MAQIQFTDASALKGTLRGKNKAITLGQEEIQNKNFASANVERARQSETTELVINGGRDGNRTRTPLYWRRILSPLRLPIPSPGLPNPLMKELTFNSFLKTGAGNESRTRDLNLGKVALYQLSYSRVINFYGGAKRSRTALNGFAIRCITALLSRHLFHKERQWSGKRVSNSRPQPWQGCALPTELFPHQRSTYFKDIFHFVKNFFHLVLRYFVFPFCINHLVEK